MGNGGRCALGDIFGKNDVSMVLEHELGKAQDEDSVQTVRNNRELCPMADKNYSGPTFRGRRKL